MLAAIAAHGRAGDKDACPLMQVWFCSTLWGEVRFGIFGGHPSHQHRAQVAEHIPAPPAGNAFCEQEEWVGKTAPVYSVQMLSCPTEHHTVPKPTQSRVVNKHSQQKTYAVPVCVGGDDCLHPVCTVKGNGSPRSLGSLPLGQTACHWAAPLITWLDFSTCSAQSS